MTIDIIGSGIGGLTTAIALKRKGIQSRVYEQAKEIMPVGAGIILANNAMQVYEKLGLREKIEKCGNPISFMNITDPKLRAISNVDLKYFEEKYQVQNIAIHRGKLQEILLSQIEQSEINLGYKLKHASAKNNEFELKFENGESINSKILLGADGINSVVRKCLFKENKIRNAFQVCWRGVTEYNLPKQYQHELNEAWGKERRFGFVQLAPNQVYWYALISFKNDPTEYTVDKLNTYFNNFDPVANEIINSTDNSKIHTATIYDLHPIKKWYDENVCLLGDAAHATTPNLGQGACQAIEDAFILSECLGKYELNRAFSEFQKLRIKKAHNVVNTSWTLGKISHWKNPLAVTTRNLLMKMTPQSVSRKQSESIFQLSKF